MRDGTLLDFKRRVRTVLCSRLKLTAADLIAITDGIAVCVAPAIDEEVMGIVNSCGLMREEFANLVPS